MINFADALTQLSTMVVQIQALPDCDKKAQAQANMLSLLQNVQHGIKLFETGVSQMINCMKPAGSVARKGVPGFWYVPNGGMYMHRQQGRLPMGMRYIPACAEAKKHNNPTAVKARLEWRANCSTSSRTTCP